MAEQLDRIGAGPTRIGVGKVLADVAEPGRPEERVGAGMCDDVSVAVAVEPALAREDTPTEHQDAARIVAEAMDVEALADPNVDRRSVMRAPGRLQGDGPTRDRPVR